MRMRGVVNASDLVEVVGDPSEGSAVLESEISVEGITGTRSKLVQETENDTTLKIARELGKREVEGYHFKDGVLLRTRLDRQGTKVEQLCLNHLGNSVCRLHTPNMAIWGVIKCAPYSHHCSIGQGSREIASHL